MEESAGEADQNLAPHLEYFADRVYLMFAYYFCILEFRDDPDLSRDISGVGRPWMLKTIQNACLHTSLIALRALDDFFSPRTGNSKPDDLKASDCGIDGALQFLTANERKSINKLIAHMTSRGAQELTCEWDLLELISKALAQCDVFFELIKKNYGLDHFYAFTTALITQATVKAIMEEILAELSLYQDRKENGQKGKG